MNPHTLSSTLLLVACAGAAPAMESMIVGPRALGMGGAGVACADDYVAQYYNPALFGFFGRREGDERSAADNQDLGRKGWGFGLDLTAGGRIGGDLATYADQLSDIDGDRLSDLSSGGSSPQAVQDAVRIASVVGNLAPRADTVTVLANAGAGLRIGSFAVGARGFADATAWADDIDTANLSAGAPITTSQLASNIAGSAADPGVGYTPTFFSASELTSIASALGGDATAQAAARIIDQQAAASGVDKADAQSIVDSLLASGGVIDGLTSGGSIDDNTTMVKVTGLSVAEVAMSYGYAFNDHLAIGASAKLLIGRVYGMPWQPFQDNRDYQDVIRDARDNYRQTVTGTIDLGVVARFPWLQLGLTGRNLTAPTFKGPTVAAAGGREVVFDDQRLDPSLTAGVAFVPHPTLTVALDGDLLETGSSREGYDQQRLGGGVEWDIARVLALRAGLSKNLAEGDTGLLYHAGLGLNLWAVRIDLAGMLSSETVTYDGDEYPREAQVSLALATDW